MCAFKEIELEFDNAISGITLKGTLAIPESNSEIPLIVLVTGTGAHNRDEQIGTQKPFKQISDYLANNGFAVVRYDDRHYGMPTRKAWSYTTADFVTDVQAVINGVMRKNIFQVSSIGIIGHSEGGIIASKVALIDSRIKAIVGLGSPAISMKEISIRQSKELWTKNEKQSKFGNAARRIVENESNEKLRRIKIWLNYFKIFGVLNFKEMYTQYQWMDITASEWNHYIHNIKPIDYLKSLKCSALMLYGEFDTQVRPDDNISEIDSVNTTRETAIETIIIKNANHQFQYTEKESKAKYEELVKEYIESKNGIMESVLEQISIWLRQKFKTA